MMYSVIPHDQTPCRFFASFSGMEQFVLQHAILLESRNIPSDWCSVIAYEGIDELLPVFVYNLMGGHTLVRSPINL